MRGFAQLYGDPRLALEPHDQRFWSQALACGVARDGTQSFVPLGDVPVVPLTEEPRARRRRPSDMPANCSLRFSRGRCRRPRIRHWSGRSPVTTGSACGPIAAI